MCDDDRVRRSGLEMDVLYEPALSQDHGNVAGWG